MGDGKNDDEPKCTIFVENGTNCPLSLKAAWLGGDARWDGEAKTKQDIEEKVNFVFTAEKSMAGILVFDFQGEICGVGFQSSKCPDIKTILSKDIPSNFRAEWMECHQENVNKAFIRFLGETPKGCDVSLKPLALDTALLAKLTFEVNYKTFAMSCVAKGKTPEQAALESIQNVSTPPRRVSTTGTREKAVGLSPSVYLNS